MPSPNFLAPLIAPVGGPGATVFGFMFLLDSLTRALMVSVIPITAYHLLQSERDVSLLYLAIGVLGLGGTLSIPLLIQIMRRRWVYSLGCGALVGMGGLIATGTLAGLASGMWLRVFGTAALYTTLNLYIMDYIQKRELVRTEPMRLVFGGVSWTFGPLLGMYVSESMGTPVACAISAVIALLLFGYFWLLRIRDNPAVAPATRPPPSVAYNVRRFVSQPRMRLAYAIAFSRSTWWTMFFVYAPLFMVKAGYGATASAAVVSAGNAMLFLSMVYGRMARHTGVRSIVVGAYAICGVLSLVVALLAENPMVAAGFLILGAAAATAIDALGGITFLRAVHPYERAEMATVYSTYRQISDITAPMVYALILTFLPLPAVFACSGVVMLVMARIALHLPRGL
ncbi:MAG: MFS transporter [Alphaproteobacteria bacterium]|nr:MFS transporter [Alphaproteobacteria bacterium]